jgi:8-oxo-dGTP pyrophosphatase MutT (NUDIX family)
MAANRQLEEKDFEKFLKGVPTSTDGGIKGDVDVFNGVTIGPEHLVDMTYERLKKQLPLALKTWLEEGKRGIWIKIPTNQSELISIATNLGFDFHHAQPGYVLLTKWLPSMEPNKLPRYANHQIGVAGLVVNDKDELLVIQEKYLRSLRRPIWKFPGGLADPGEDLYETAIREVKEETGIDTEFVSVLCFRHMHELKWGIDDLYFICLLRPLNTNIVMDEAEISACKWMKVAIL